MENEVAVIYCGVNGLLENVPLTRSTNLRSLFIQLLKSRNQDVLDTLRAKARLTEDVENKLRQCAEEVASRYKS